MTDENKIDAKVDQFKGSTKEVFGKVTGDKKTETEGKVDKTFGKVKEAAENVKEEIEGAISGLKNRKHKDE
ncbi:CsbD family protein [Lactococcus fujiensis]|uniref:CsbD-like domain-containing protein n=1 Tax=Lactococcus fujiensis JCM 16395 TaxID=1291764 RepID=A0A2A5RIP5_9LACT|nr:CsbD family protein [Lactococcus fujiensis]PCR98960.1 hypothetical protein RT41_GL000591 [Lactococcus fujiensis JCM 16395]